MRAYDKVLIPEMNLGQLRMLIRAQFLVDAAGYNKVRGRPFRAAELADASGDPDQAALPPFERGCYLSASLSDPPTAAANPGSLFTRAPSQAKDADWMPVRPRAKTRWNGMSGTGFPDARRSPSNHLPT